MKTCSCRTFQSDEVRAVEVDHSQQRSAVGHVLQQVIQQGEVLQRPTREVIPPVAHLQPGHRREHSSVQQVHGITVHCTQNTINFFKCCVNTLLQHIFSIVQHKIIHKRAVRTMCLYVPHDNSVDVSLGRRCVIWCYAILTDLAVIFFL